jgi:hypothetical protein
MRTLRKAEVESTTRSFRWTGNNSEARHLRRVTSGASPPVRHLLWYHPEIIQF